MRRAWSLMCGVLIGSAAVILILSLLSVLLVEDEQDYKRRARVYTRSK